MGEARRAEKGRPGHTKGGDKRSACQGGKPARASGPQPPHMPPFLAAPTQNLRTKANTGEQRYLAPAWPTNAMRDPRRGAATEVSRGEHATAVRGTYRDRLVALPHRAHSPTAPSAPKLDHALGRPHHRRARGFSAASRRTPHEPSPWPTAGPPAYAHGPWARAAPSPLLRRGQVPVGCACACTQPSLRSAIFYQRTSEVQFLGGSGTG